MSSDTCSDCSKAFGIVFNRKGACGSCKVVCCNKCLKYDHDGKKTCLKCHQKFSDGLAAYFVSAEFKTIAAEFAETHGEEAIDLANKELYATTEHTEGVMPSKVWNKLVKACGVHLLAREDEGAGETKRDRHGVRSDVEGQKQFAQFCAAAMGARIQELNPDENMWDFGITGY